MSCNKSSALGCKFSGTLTYGVKTSKFTEIVGNFQKLCPKNIQYNTQARKTTDNQRVNEYFCFYICFSDTEASWALSQRPARTNQPR